MHTPEKNTSTHPTQPETGPFRFEHWRLIESFIEDIDIHSDVLSFAAGYEDFLPLPRILEEEEMEAKEDQHAPSEEEDTNFSTVPPPTYNESLAFIYPFLPPPIVPEISMPYVPLNKQTSCVLWLMAIRYALHVRPIGLNLLFTDQDFLKMHQALYNFWCQARKGLPVVEIIRFTLAPFYIFKMAEVDAAKTDMVFNNCLRVTVLMRRCGEMVVIFRTVPRDPNVLLFHANGRPVENINPTNVPYSTFIPFINLPGMHHEFGDCLIWPTMTDKTFHVSTYQECLWLPTEENMPFHFRRTYNLPHTDKTAAGVPHAAVDASRSYDTHRIKNMCVPTRKTEQDRQLKMLFIQ